MCDIYKCKRSKYNIVFEVAYRSKVFHEITGVRELLRLGNSRVPSVMRTFKNKGYDHEHYNIADGFAI